VGGKNGSVIVSVVCFKSMKIQRQFVQAVQAFFFSHHFFEALLK